MQAYLDVASTGIPKNEWIESKNYFWGNASSKHSIGERSKDIICHAKKYFENSLKLINGEFIFTSGATESNNSVIKGFAMKQCGVLKKNIHYITTKAEHESILAPIEQMKLVFPDKVRVTYLSLESSGEINKVELTKTLEESDVVSMLCISYMNSEIGTVEDLNHISDACRRTSTFLHVDASQGFESFINCGDWEIGSLTASGHKVHGSKGVGILYLNHRFKNFCLPLISGGGQQDNLRSGTENAEAIYSFEINHSYANIWQTENYRKVLHYYEKIKEAFSSIPEFKLYTKRQIGITPRIMCMGFGYYGETVQQMLDDMNVQVSVGSACSSGKMKYNKTLIEIGVPEDEALQAIRVSFDYTTTEEEIDYFIKCMKIILDKLKNM